MKRVLTVAVNGSGWSFEGNEEFSNYYTEKIKGNFLLLSLEPSKKQVKHILINGQLQEEEKWKELSRMTFTY